MAAIVHLLSAVVHLLVVDYYPFAICAFIEAALVLRDRFLRDLDAL